MVNYIYLYISQRKDSDDQSKKYKVNNIYIYIPDQHRHYSIHNEKLELVYTYDIDL